MLIWLKKLEHCKLKNIKKFESIYKNGKNNNKIFGIEKLKFHQYKKPISIKNVDINKIVVSNKVSFGKKSSKYFIGCKDTKKLDLYEYYFQKWVHIEKTLMKLNICLFS